MTETQAIHIEALFLKPEIKSLIEVQTEIKKSAVNVQGTRAWNTPLGRFCFEEGVVQGIEDNSFIQIYNEAQEVLKKIHEDAKRREIERNTEMATT